jgi:acetyl-CoA carboxylase biotin carboxyl carrier protein
MSMKIDADAIRELAGLLEATGLNEIEVADGDKGIRVSKGGTIVGAAPVAMSSDPAIPQIANTSGPATTANSHPGAVTSPMVGPLYMRADPDAAPFVSKGDNVKAGDTLVIIEAMKVMNPIKADKSGVVTQILVDDAQPVEFGDVLIVVE